MIMNLKNLFILGLLYNTQYMSAIFINLNQVHA